MKLIFTDHLQIYGTYELFEKTNYLGYLTLIVILLTIIFVTAKNNFHLILSNKFKIIFFLLLFTLAMILSFGPDYYLSYDISVQPNNSMRRVNFVSCI